jgi:hypothetical protein
VIRNARKHVALRAQAHLETDVSTAARAQPAPPPPAAQPDGRIEITLARGVTVRVDAKVDAAALRRVLAALERP